MSEKAAKVQIKTLKTPKKPEEVLIKTWLLECVMLGASHAKVLDVGT